MLIRAFIQSTECKVDRFEVSTSGTDDLSDADKYCGNDFIATSSIGNKLVFGT